MKIPFVYILLLNWNGWKDTIECLESVFRLDYDNYRVIVCDNNSSDNSLEHIMTWAEGRLDVLVPLHNQLRHHSYPPVPKPIPYLFYDRQKAEAGGSVGDTGWPLILIQTGGNLGFAGGNNVGLRYAMARNDFDYVWLLNNDTVIDVDALTEIVNKMTSTPNTGLCGSVLVSYDQPNYIQSAGGRFNHFVAITSNLLEGTPISGKMKEDVIINHLSYPIGASMTVSSQLLEKIGPLCEDYFFYFEELDWATRSRTLFNITIASDSKVYHKEGASIAHPNKQAFSLYYYQLNRLRFMHKFYSRYLICVLIHIVMQVFKALILFRWQNAWASVRAIYKFIG